MRSRHTSGFNPSDDNRASEEGAALLMIAGAVVAALLSGAMAFLSSIGWGVPPVLSLLFGMLIGAGLGICLQRSISS